MISHSGPHVFLSSGVKRLKIKRYPSLVLYLNPNTLNVLVYSFTHPGFHSHTFTTLIQHFDTLSFCLTEAVSLSQGHSAHTLVSVQANNKANFLDYSFPSNICFSVFFLHCLDLLSFIYLPILAHIYIFLQFFLLCALFQPARFYSSCSIIHTLFSARRAPTHTFLQRALPLYTHTHFSRSALTLAYTQSHTHTSLGALSF